MFDKFKDKVGGLFSKNQQQDLGLKAEPPKKDEPIKHEDKIFSGEAAKKDGVVQKGIGAPSQPGSQIGCATACTAEAR